GLGNVTVGHSGNITSTTGSGVHATSIGNVSVATGPIGGSTSTIQGYHDGIFADSTFVGTGHTVTVTSHSNIIAGNATAGNDGIEALSSGYGAVTVGSYGNITAHVTGIVDQGNGTVLVTTGAGTSIHAVTGDGIFANSHYACCGHNGYAVTVTSNSNIY